MPLPRKTRQKRAAKGTRASRRNARESAWVIAKIAERFERFAALLEEKREHEVATGVCQRALDNPPKEKAPDLATGGSILSEDQNA